MKEEDKINAYSILQEAFSSQHKENNFKNENTLIMNNSVNNLSNDNMNSLLDKLVIYCSVYNVT